MSSYLFKLGLSYDHLLGYTLIKVTSSMSAPYFTFPSNTGSNKSIVFANFLSSTLTLTTTSATST